MKKIVFTIGLFSSVSLLAQSNKPELWYKHPASKWTEALPVGNGRLGAMVFGDYKNERLQLNEESVWAGSKINNNNPGAKEHLPQIQQAIFKGDYKTALELSNKYLVGTPPRVRSYQPLGDLTIHFHWKNEPTAYRRSLDLSTGISKTTYTVDGNKIAEEVFVSAPQDIIVVSISADKIFDAELLLSREFNSDYENAGKRRKTVYIKPVAENNYQNKDGFAFYTGQIIDSATAGQGPGGKHMHYAAVMKILSINGKSNSFESDSAAGFQVKEVKNMVVMITGATDYNIDQLDTDPKIDPLDLCKKIISKANSFNAEKIKADHIKDHQLLFNRVHFSLGNDDNQLLSTDERLAKLKEGKTDKGLITLYYQYGRYLLMGSSRRPGRLPANLQGIWNDLYDAPWSADFHTNINLQMNYWPAETGNLSETSVVLANFVKQLVVPGTVTAKEMYGANGWTIHHLTDPFGRTGVMDGVWGITSMDGPWMTFPLYDHFEFSADTNFLKQTAYPVIKGSVEFVLDFLVKSPDGYLVTNPSHSPENSFFVPGTDKKEKSQMTYAPTVDIHIINALFNNFMHAAKLLHVDEALVSKVKKAQKQLPPLKVSAMGTLQEWIEDFDEVEPGHRHMSHLLGLYPLDLINPNNPIIFEAARKTLERRLANGGGHTGWSKAWIINLYARLHDGDKAAKNLDELLQKSTLDNLFDTHPPFQIDGNFGGTAAIAEMLLQSQNGVIQLLPALPASWADGSMHGLRARGALTVSLDWKEGKLLKAILKSDKGGTYQLLYKGKTKEVKLTAGQSVELNGLLN